MAPLLELGARVGPQDCAAIGWQSTSNTTTGSFSKPKSIATYDSGCRDGSCRDHVSTTLAPLPRSFSNWLDLSLEQQAQIATSYGAGFINLLLEGKVEKRYWAVYFAIAQLYYTLQHPTDSELIAIDFFTISDLNGLRDEAAAAGDHDVSGWAYAQSIHGQGWSDAGVDAAGLTFGLAGAGITGFGAGRRVGVNSQYAADAGVGPDNVADGGEGGSGFTVGGHAQDRMNERGWSNDDIADAIANPVRTERTVDHRHNPDGTQVDDEPATAYYSADGGWVVVNDRTGDVVAVSKRTGTWDAEWEK